MESLMNAEEAEEVGWGRVGRSAAFSFPKGGVEIVSFTQYSSFSHIEGLGNSFQLKKASS